MVLIEAMAHECPCVAFESQGPNQIIENGHTGVLVESGRDDIFAEKLSFLISDAGLRQQMGREARESIKEYDIDRVGGKWVRMLSSYI
jgi:glycosyltransferase involved in cell wall biosynthesis